MANEWIKELREKAESAQYSHKGPYIAVESSDEMGYPHNDSSTLSIESKDGTTIAGTTIYRTRDVGFYFASASPDRILELLSLLDSQQSKLEEMEKELANLRLREEQAYQETLRARSAEASAEAKVAELEKHMDAGVECERRDRSKALLALSAATICTPEEGYGTNSSWAVSDLCRAVAELSKQIIENNSRAEDNYAAAEIRTHGAEDKIKDLQASLEQASTCDSGIHFIESEGCKYCGRSWDEAIEHAKQMEE